ncbi:MAG: hypothetical protein OXF25_02970 [Cyanobacteria bacterium MAG CAR3_bin_5]|nr:hypothetical protein [Cyanobacteria bacterium MAG CAR3_bin_5]
MPTSNSTILFLFEDFDKIPDYEFCFSTKDLALELGLDSKAVLAFANARKELSKLRRKRGTGYFWFKFWRMWFYGIIGKTVISWEKSLYVNGEIKEINYKPLDFSLICKRIKTIHERKQISEYAAHRLIKDLRMIYEGDLSIFSPKEKQIFNLWPIDEDS